MADGSDAIADWPLLNALVNTASGTTWVSIHHGGGVGIGRSLHAGQVTVADGTLLAARKIERVLSNDLAWASYGTLTPETPLAIGRCAATPMVACGCPHDRSSKPGT